jgi:hypothetical protein
VQRELIKERDPAYLSHPYGLAVEFPQFQLLGDSVLQFCSVRLSDAVVRPEVLAYLKPRDGVGDSDSFEGSTMRVSRSEGKVIRRMIILMRQAREA